MRKMMLILLIALALPYAISAQDPDYQNYETLTADVSLGSEMTIIKGSASSMINNVEVLMDYYPRQDFRQQVISTSQSPKAKIDPEGALVFSWDNPIGESLEFGTESVIRTQNIIPKVRTKVAFPIRDLDQDIREYVKETESVDFTHPAIRRNANLLAEGEDDLYVVVHKLAEYVNTNIEYDLNTVTATASQPASWVMENRQGVCDEITNLFLAHCRALGIPARFVSGLSYTNLEQFPEKWSAHGWAEVYFPGYGWIPFDVTYGQFGYIDITHIKLKDDFDANRSSTRYRWEGHDVNLQIREIDTDVEVQSMGNRLAPLLEIETRMMRDKVGFGSSNVAAVEVTNTNDHYVPTEVSISRTEELKVKGEYSRHVLLEPSSKKTLFWEMELDDGLDPGFIYTFMVRGYTIRNASSIATFQSSREFSNFDEDDAAKFIAGLLEEESKEYSREIGLLCNPDKEAYFSAEKIIITCSLENRGNTALDDIDVCLEDDCISMDLGISERKQAIFFSQDQEPGRYDRIVSAVNNDISKTGPVAYHVMADPVINLIDLSYPKEIDFGSDFSIDFTLRPQPPESVSQLDIEVYMDGKLLQSWESDDMKTDKRYILNINRYALPGEDNNFTIQVDYQDTLGRKYTKAEEFSIKATGVNAGSKVIMTLNRSDLSLLQFILIFGGIILVTVAMIGLIFGERRKS